MNAIQIWGVATVKAMHHTSICSESSAGDARAPVIGNNQQEQPLGQTLGMAGNLARMTTPITEAPPTTSALIALHHH